MREDPSLSHLFRSSDHTFLHAPLPTFDRPMVSASGSALTRDEAAASAMWERALQTKRVRATKQLVRPPNAFADFSRFLDLIQMLSVDTGHNQVL
jgi:hypothetical protein